MPNFIGSVTQQKMFGQFALLQQQQQMLLQQQAALRPRRPLTSPDAPCTPVHPLTRPLLPSQAAAQQQLHAQQVAQQQPAKAARRWSNSASRANSRANSRARQQQQQQFHQQFFPQQQQQHSVPGAPSGPYTNGAMDNAFSSMVASQAKACAPRPAKAAPTDDSLHATDLDAAKMLGSYALNAVRQATRGKPRTRRNPETSATVPAAAASEGSNAGKVRRTFMFGRKKK